MAIKFACPTCQHAFKTDEKFAGRQATCPSCRNTLTIPSLPEPELVPAAERLVAHTPKLSQSAPRPFATEELSEDFNPFASPHAEDTRPSFAGMYQQPAPEWEVSYGSFLSRWAAAFLDGLIVGVGRVIGIVILNIGAVILLGLAGGNGEGPVTIALGIFAGIAVIFGLPWLYDAFMESSSSQATLGKMTLGLKVTNLHGQPISFGQATGRHFGKYLSRAVLCLGYLIQPFTEKKQALHDMLSGCLVIRTR